VFRSRIRARPISNESGALPKDSIFHKRQDMYLANHYTTLHVTVVGLALGVASAAAASLLAGTPSPSFDGYQPTFYLLWLASLLAIAVAYGGPMIANILMPPRVPAVVDLILPLLLGVCEFLQFTILGYRLTGWTSARAVLAGWWITFAAFNLLAALGTWRAYHLIGKANEEPQVGIVIKCTKRLGFNRFGALATAVLCSLVGVFYLTRIRLPADLRVAFAVAAIIALLGALETYRRMANELRVELGRAFESTTVTTSNPAVGRGE
jgi:hypothetical protein